MVKKGQSLLMYDAVGMLLVLAALAVGVWTGLIAPGSGNQALGYARTELDRILRDANTMEAAVHAQESDLSKLKLKVAAEGALPTRSPVEANLREITDLANRHYIKVSNILPVGLREHAGVTELKQAITANGAYADLISFLRGFEKAKFWADIIELKISNRATRGDESMVKPTVSLDVSLFAAPSPEDTEVQ